MSYRLQVEAIEARSLMPFDFNGWSDPYCQIIYSKKTKIGKTDYIKRTLNPVWKKTFFKYLDIDFSESIRIEIYDHDTLGDDFMGQVEIPLQEYSDGKWSRKWYRLMDKKNKRFTRGYVHVQVQVVPEGVDASLEGDRRPGDDAPLVRNLHISSITQPEPEQGEQVADEESII